jgi:8-oxo-dGTP diphosphatase
MSNSVQEIYKNRLRIRACGICINNNRVLLVNHLGLTKGDFWSPPGGGIQLGETAADCVVREFREETGLIVEVRDFLFACELIKEPLHAVELFFLVKETGGKLAKGIDPESGSNQIIADVRYLEWGEINALSKANLHGIFGLVEKVDKILDLRGYFKL